MGQLVSILQRGSWTSLRYSETDTGAMDIDLEFPAGRWEVAGVSMRLDADNSSATSYGLLLHLAPGSISTSLRTLSFFKPNLKSQAATLTWGQTFSPLVETIIENGDYLKYQNTDQSTSVGATAIFIVTARLLS